MKAIKVICAWCKKVMRDSGDQFFDVSHGMCEECLCKEIVKIDEKRMVQK